MKRIAIIGGGFAGAKIAKALENSFAVTLFDTKNYFEFTPSVLRTLVEPSHCKNIEVLHTHYLHKTQIVQEKVTAITKKKVCTKNAEYRYEYIVICSGSTYASPIKAENVVLSNRSKELREQAKAVKEAKYIAIIGGGIVGVELAAEITTTYPEKKVSIFQSPNVLMKRQPKKAQDYATTFLKKRKVSIHYNQRVQEYKDKVIITNKRHKEKADIVFLCVGISPNSNFLKKDFSQVLNERNFVQVEPTLQVKGHKNIFAAGDVVAILEEKTAQSAEAHAQVVIKNIFSLEKKKPLETYMPKSKPMVISLGSTCGIVTYKNTTITGIIPGILKRIIEYKAMYKYK